MSVAYFGDGAVNNGAFHEGCNMATVWELPVLFVCENNLYATEVPFATVTKEQSVARKAEAYALPHAVVDGNDVREVHGEAGQAIARARAGGGPTLLECRTYRHRSHAEGMRETGYRTREEVEEWKTSDPILALRACLTDDGTASPRSWTRWMRRSPERSSPPTRRRWPAANPIRRRCSTTSWTAKSWTGDRSAAWRKPITSRPHVRRWRRR